MTNRFFSHVKTRTSVAPFTHVAVPSAQFVEKLSWRLSIVAIAGVVALVLVYKAPSLPGPSATCTSRSYGQARSCYRPRQAHEPSESTN